MASKYLWGAILIAIILPIGGLLYSRGISKPNPTATSHQTISDVAFPKGGEILEKGKVYKLRWTKLSEGKTQIFLKNNSLADEGESVSIVDKVYNVPNSGSHIYTMPLNIPDGKYIFEIGSLKSNEFSIGSNALSFCSPKSLQASLELSPGAGNVYGTFKITNVSGSDCQIQGGKFIQANFDKSSAQNIKVADVGQTQPENFTLSNNSSLYSQIHYPNGPQCSGSPKQISVSFSYEVSPNQNINFMAAGKNSVNVPSCTSPSETTQIQIWNMSASPITP